MIQLLEPAQDSAQLLIVLATGSTLILLVTLFAARYLTRISAATRYAIWQIGILSLGLLPLGWLCLPEIPLGLFATGLASSIQEGENDASVFPVRLAESGTITDTPKEDSTSTPSDLRSASAGASNKSSAAELRSKTFKRMSASDQIILVWLGVAGIFLTRMAVNYLRTALATRMVVIAKPVINSEQLELPAHVSLCYSEHLKVPIAVGILRKRIILPREAEYWNADQFRMVLKHELAHIERNDAFWQLTISVFKSIFWFQPLLWWAAQESALVREQACDDRVIASGEDKTDYATTLIQIAASISGRTVFLSGALSMSEKPIERRLQAILSSNSSRSPACRRVACFAASVALLVATGLCSLRPFQPIPIAAQEADSGSLESSSKQELAIDAGHLLQKRPNSYKLNAGDVLGVFIEGVLGEAGSVPSVYLGVDEAAPPAIGFPVPVREDGTLSLPLIKPIPVRGLTVQQSEALIRQTYCEGSDPIVNEDCRIIVTLLRERTYRVFVVRRENNLQRGFVLNLPAYKNDVLNALMMTGGLPRKHSVSEVRVLHTDNTQHNLTRDFEIAEFYKTRSPKDFPYNAIPPLEKASGTLEIPMRIESNSEIEFKTDDIILQNGDVVYVDSKPQNNNKTRQ